MLLPHLTIVGPDPIVAIEGAVRRVRALPVHVVIVVDEVLSHHNLGGTVILIRATTIAGEPGVGNFYATTINTTQVDHLVSKFPTCVAIKRRVVPSDQKV